MDIRKIKKLIELVEESGINEIEISEGEESIRINKGTVIAGAPMMQAAPMAAPAVAPAVAPAADSAPAAPALSGHVVRSPMLVLSILLLLLMHLHSLKSVSM